MEEARILSEIQDILSSTFKIKAADVRVDSKLDDDLGLDSVDIMDSLGLFEERFNITIFKNDDSSEGPKILTIQDLVELVKRNQK